MKRLHEPRPRDVVARNVVLLVGTQNDVAVVDHVTDLAREARHGIPDFTPPLGKVPYERVDAKQHLEVAPV